MMQGMRSVLTTRARSLRSLPYVHTTNSPAVILFRGCALSQLVRSATLLHPNVVSLRHMPILRAIAPASSLHTCSHRHFASKAHKKGGKPSSASAGTVEKKKQLPLSKILRMLWMKVHPDLMTKFPQMKKANEDSLAQLNTFLSSIKDRDGNNAYPKAQHQSIIFYLLTDKEAHFRKVQLDLHTNGGACKALVQSCLSKFFISCNLPSEFTWDQEYWPLKSVPNERERPEEQEEEREHIYSQEYNETYEEFQRRMFGGK